MRLGHHPTGEQWLAFLDGELTGREAGELADHLEACLGCRDELASLELELDGLDRCLNLECGREQPRRELSFEEVARAVRRLTNLPPRMRGRMAETVQMLLGSRLPGTEGVFAWESANALMLALAGRRATIGLATRVAQDTEGTTLGVDP